jgi:hypothetical protein
LLKRVIVVANSRYKILVNFFQNKIVSLLAIKYKEGVNNKINKEEVQLILSPKIEEGSKALNKFVINKNKFLILPIVKQR